ncbi:hypothetical protein I4641_10285 [Waterburya agarophytonicola K14]|uniref:Uncharacterized protein n=1 Tax=Waterburya agarophytonicola KI4 TaxID=2874699 RepID=A0A964BPT5_9CYAN|nr:hypothetical protein [Waterburya agarophytonicola]MCC0177363.1 hypothetical protein [Waterburya agarophytonicola KI4]
MSLTLIGIIAGFVGLLGYLPYIITTLQGKTKPNRATWWVWGLLGIIQIISYYYSESNFDSAIWLLACYTLCQIIMAVLSIKFGEGGWDKLDKFCFFGVILSVILWQLFNSASIALLFTIIIDMFGAVPTVVKSYYEPEKESSFSWTIFLIANSLNLVAIGSWSLRSIYPFYLFCLSLTLTILLHRSKIFNKTTHKKLKRNHNKVRQQKHS